MSCVAEAKAAMMKSTSVNQNIEIGTCPPAMAAASGRGSVSVRRIIMAVIRACIVMIHQRLVLTTSTIGLQIPLRNHGK